MFFARKQNLTIFEKFYPISVFIKSVFMKRFVFAMTIFCTIFSGNNSIAQDLIVGIEGDSLNCFIVKETVDKVFFSTKINGSFKRMNLPKNQIKSITKSYFKTFDELNDKSIETINSEPYTRIRLSVEYGRSKIFNAITFGNDTFLKSLKNSLNGNAINFSGVYFFRKNSGIGLDCFFLKPSSKLKLYKVNSGIYVGPSFSYRGYFEVSDMESITSISPGIVFFTTTNQLEYTVGVNFSQSFEQPLSENIFFGLGGRIYVDLYGESFVQLNAGIKYNFLDN